MTSRNYRRNKAAIKAYRKELKEMFDDISEIDVKILNKSVNEGVKVAKERTNVSKGGNIVEFYTREGKHVRFKISKSLVGGFMRRSWKALPTKKDSKGVSKKMVNMADYASYVNYGHVIKNKKNGPIKGFVKGQYMLEKAQRKVQKVMLREFKKEIERVNRKHGK